LRPSRQSGSGGTRADEGVRPNSKLYANTARAGGHRRSRGNRFFDHGRRLDGRGFVFADFRGSGLVLLDLRVFADFRGSGLILLGRRVFADFRGSGLIPLDGRVFADFRGSGLMLLDRRLFHRRRVGEWRRIGGSLLEDYGWRLFRSLRRRCGGGSRIVTLFSKAL